MIIYKGRKEYDFIVLTLKMSNYDDFLGVFKDKEDIDKYFESSSFNVEGGAYTGWQMKVGDVVGQEIFDFDLGLSSNDDVR